MGDGAIINSPDWSTAYGKKAFKWAQEVTQKFGVEDAAGFKFSPIIGLAGAVGGALLGYYIPPRVTFKTLVGASLFFFPGWMAGLAIHRTVPQRVQAKLQQESLSVTEQWIWKEIYDLTSNQKIITWLSAIEGLLLGGYIGVDIGPSPFINRTNMLVLGLFYGFVWGACVGPILFEAAAKGGGQLVGGVREMLEI